MNAATQVAVSVQDFDSICRFCLQRDGELTSIFNGRRRGVAAADDNDDAMSAATAPSVDSDWTTMVGELTGLQMHQHDGLPLWICNSCTFQLASSHSFRQQCIASVEVLMAVKTSASGSGGDEDDGVKSEHYMVEEEPYVEWQHDEDDVVQIRGEHGDDDIDVKGARAETVSSLLHIEPAIHFADDSTSVATSISAATPTSATSGSNKKPRKAYTRRTTVIKVEESSVIDEVIVHVEQKCESRSSVTPPPMTRRGRKPRALKVDECVNGAKAPSKAPKMEQCEVCGFISRSLKTHMMTHTNEKKYECDFCGKKFALRSSMKNHLFAHVNIRPITCTLCPATFISPGYLRKHMPTHDKQYNLTCTTCGRQFARQFILNKHMRTHQQHRTHQCKFCPHSFISRDGLRNHIGVHTGERPFKCGLCPMRFKFTGASSNHRRAMHMVDGQYRCAKCGFAVESFPLFKVHLLSCPLDAWWETEEAEKEEASLHTDALAAVAALAAESTVNRGVKEEGVI